VIHRLDQDYVRQVDFWAVISAALGVSAWLVWLFQGTCFAVSSEKLVVRAKYQVFQAVLRQDMQFFDEKAHSPGALASLVSTSTNDLAGVSGPVLGSILTCITTIVVGIVISMIAGWKLALVCTSAVPIVVACGWLRLRILVIFDRQIRKTNEDAAAYASEMVSAIRTVASLCLEQHVLDEYQRLLEQQASQSVKTILQASIFYGFSHSLHFLAAALAFWYGGKMIVEEGYSITSVFVCFTALVSGAQIAGAVFTFAPDASKAMHASQELKSLLDRRPQIEGKCPDAQPPAEIEGRIHFESVSFCYPTRPEHSVLNAFNLSIEPGQYIAFVGPSGGGKSTLIALLERFFDPAHGRILVDGQDISALDVYKYRQQLSLVSQEPILFQGTIRENLLLGAAKDVSDEDVLRTCKEANLGDFLSSLPYVQSS
jgi:ATP-binding cassette subfamily B (MDR/TAP) protein 1